MTNEKMDGLSMDIEQVEQDKLRAVFPQCFTDGQLDERKLLQLLGVFNSVGENDREKYEFRWKGRQESLRLARKRSAGALRPCPEESVNWDGTENLYIEGDNLEVLKLLQQAYFRKVKMIYIDPPYNTGNDFVYADDFADPLRRYREVTLQTAKSNPEYMGRFHTKWLNMMLPRLKLASNLLRDDGVIFISIDDNEVHNLRKLCDEIFGEENFIAQIIVKTNPGGRDYGGLALTHEYLLTYGKLGAELNLVFDKGKKFIFFDELGGFDVRELRNRNIKFNENNRPNLCYPFYVNPNGVDENGLYELSLEAKNNWVKVMPLVSQGVQTVWRWGKDKTLSNLNINLKGRKKQDGTFMIVEKYRSSMRRERTIWDEASVRNEAGSLALSKLFPQKPFDYPKSLETIKRAVALGSNSSGIILDFFSGSATTAHAVMQLNAEDGGNRKFIMVQLPELTGEKSEAYKAGYRTICDIGKERIRRAGRKLCSEELKGGQLQGENNSSFSNLDAGFKVFKLDSSNLKLWDDSPIKDEGALQELEARIRDMIDVIKPGRSELDIVCEVMLKLGQELTQPIIPITLKSGRVVHGIGRVSGDEGSTSCGVKFFLCLARGITPGDALEMAAYAPGRIVFADSCFDNTGQKSNVHLSLKDKGIAVKTL
ncbi:MAG: site-specific DNA-methyltransferase [Oscillospiraceae bacterium]|nr:site-specific DNA-methyltransferase [Oscillospiraceae bacterium]